MHYRICCRNHPVDRKGKLTSAAFSGDEGLARKEFSPRDKLVGGGGGISNPLGSARHLIDHSRTVGGRDQAK
jgi:hypothetical protein